MKRIIYILLIFCSFKTHAQNSGHEILGDQDIFGSA